MTLEIAPDAKRMPVSDPCDIVREAKGLLFTLIERVVRSAERKLRHVCSGPADEVAQTSRAGAIVEKQRRIGNTHRGTGEFLGQERIIQRSRVVQIKETEPRLVNYSGTEDVLV